MVHDLVKADTAQGWTFIVNFQLVMVRRWVVAGVHGHSKEFLLDSVASGVGQGTKSSENRHGHMARAGWRSGCCGAPPYSLKIYLIGRKNLMLVSVVRTKDGLRSTGTCPRRQNLSYRLCGISAQYRSSHTRCQCVHQLNARSRSRHVRLEWVAPSTAQPPKPQRQPTPTAYDQRRGLTAQKSDGRKCSLLYR